MKMNSFFSRLNFRQHRAGPKAVPITIHHRISAAVLALPVAFCILFASQMPVHPNPVGGGIAGAIAGTAIGGLLGGKDGALAGAIVGGTAGALAGADAAAERRAKRRWGREIFPERPPLAPSRLVLRVQESLALLGYDPGRINGRLNRQTADAISAYQRNNGLPVTGRPSRELLTHMQRNGIPPTTTVSRRGSPGLYAVVGVASDDVLNVRRRPSASAPVVGALSPFATGIRRFECLIPVGSSTEWCEIRKGSTRGWVAARFLAPQFAAIPQ